jgi:hypothetical protein
VALSDISLRVCPPLIASGRLSREVEGSRICVSFPFDFKNNTVSQKESQ